jgi:hypothetical protein
MCRAMRWRLLGSFFLSCFPLLDSAECQAESNAAPSSFA